MSTTIAPAWRGALPILAFLCLQAAPSRAIEAASVPGGGSPTLSETAGELAPALVLDVFGGGRHRLEDGAGRVRLVHFFATWCEPCRPELASLDALRRDRSDAGLDILAISVAEPEARLKRYFADHSIGLTILSDRDRAVSRTWRIEALPSTIVVDRRGRTRLAVRGDLDWGRPDVRAALDLVLAETPPGPMTTTNDKPEGHRR